MGVHGAREVPFFVIRGARSRPANGFVIRLSEFVFCAFFTGGMAEKLGSGLQIRVRGCESLYHLQFSALDRLRKS
jgi:hypothetical protein